MPSILTFTAKTTSTTIGLHTVFRVTPSVHLVGKLPPLPPDGTIITMATSADTREVRVVLAGRDMMVIDVGRERWRATPLRTTEINMIGTYPEGTGATDWVILLGPFAA